MDEHFVDVIENYGLRIRDVQPIDDLVAQQPASLPEWLRIRQAVEQFGESRGYTLDTTAHTPGTLEQKK